MNIRSVKDLQKLVGCIMTCRSRVDTLDPHELIEIYPTIESYYIAWGGGAQDLSEYNKQSKRRWLSVKKNDILIVADIAEHYSYLIKIVASDGTSGWTPHFYRLQVVDDC